MKKSDLKKKLSNYNKKGQEEIFARGFDEIITYFINAGGGFLATHNKLDVFKNEEDFETAFSYACSELRDTVNLWKIFINVIEEADECCENYTPEIYLSGIINELSERNNIKEERMVFSEVMEIATEGSMILERHQKHCEMELIRLLHIIIIMHNRQLFDRIFKEKISQEDLSSLIKKFDEEDFDIDIISMMLELGVEEGFSHPMNDSTDEIIDVIVEIVKDNI